MAGRVVLELVAIVAVAGIAALVYSFREMTVQTTRSISLLQEEVLDDQSSSLPRLNLLSPERQQEEFDKLPPVVQTYLEKALPDLDRTSVAASTTRRRRVKSLSISQKGTFSLKDDHWVPFTATQYFSAALNNVGFVWDAIVFVAQPVPTFVATDVHLDLPVFVQDMYVRGKGLLEAKLLGVLPLAHMYDNADVNAGELMRWLAEALLFPTVLLPIHEQDDGKHGSSSVILQWSPAADKDPQKARLSIVDPQSTQQQHAKVSLTVHFNETTGLPSHVVGMRAKAAPAPGLEEGGFSYTRWQGNVRDYVKADGMMVPSKFEAGWWNTKKKTLELYFKGDNYDFEYTYF